MKSNDLTALWAKCLEEQADENGLLLRAQFASSKVAAAAKIELYRLRARAKKNSKKGLDPDDPAYDTSPWDHITIRHPGANRNGEGGEPILEFWLAGHSSTFTFEILPKTILDVALPRGSRTGKTAGPKPKP